MSLIPPVWMSPYTQTILDFEAQLGRQLTDAEFEKVLLASQGKRPISEILAEHPIPEGVTSIKIPRVHRV